MLVNETLQHYRRKNTYILQEDIIKLYRRRTLWFTCLQGNFHTYIKIKPNQNIDEVILAWILWLVITVLPMVFATTIYTVTESTGNMSNIYRIQTGLHFRVQHKLNNPIQTTSSHPTTPFKLELSSINHGIGGLHLYRHSLWDGFDIRAEKLKQLRSGESLRQHFGGNWLSLVEIMPEALL